MALPRNSLPPNRRVRVYPTLKAVFPWAETGEKAIMITAIKFFATTAKKIGMQSRYLLQNRSKEHEQLFNAREKF
jgi:hypothetical protein